jgi:DNA-binding MarR family transcriptional regulator
MEGKTLSSGFQEKHADLARELRQFQGLGASFFRAAATRIGLNATDMQVIDILESDGPSTAGQLADLTGLTTGAITGMLNRLEESGLVRRERDPNDGRRVIVQLVRGKDDVQAIDPIFAPMAEAWDDMVSHYSEEQISFLLTFLKQSNTLSKRAIAHLRELPADEGEGFSAPLGELEGGRLVVFSGVSRLIVRTSEVRNMLYQARFEGSVPDVKMKDEVVTIRYPQRLWLPGKEQRTADLALNATIPWHIVIQGGASEVVAELGKLHLAELKVKGGLSTIRLELPEPSGTVPIRISGGASEIIVRRPAGIATRAYLKGWASEFVFDDQHFSDVGNNVRLQSPDYETAANRYDIEVASSASMVTITAG